MNRSIFSVLVLATTAFFSAAVAQTVPRPAWQPKVQTSWQWQLTTPVDLNVDAEMFDIDLFNNSASVISAIHAKGRKAVCYISAGTWERGRPDSSQFPDAVKGKRLADYPSEKWLDVRRWDLLGPIMSARLDLCKAKGFDGVELIGVGEVLYGRRQMTDGVDVHAFSDCGFGGVFGRDYKVLNPLLAGASSDGEGAANRAYAAVEGEFARKEMLVCAMDTPHRTEDAKGHREV